MYQLFYFEFIEMIVSWCSDDSNTEAMVLLRMIADTAVKINAIDFFRIVFSTNVGRSVFKCFKDEQPLLEDIARGNGHDELASLLEEKHLMYVVFYRVLQTDKTILKLDLNL